MVAHGFMNRRSSIFDPEDGVHCYVADATNSRPPPASRSPTDIPRNCRSGGSGCCIPTLHMLAAPAVERSSMVSWDPN
ncbi:hypothetical protein Hypma_003057 [Hypsizygus marmoreus]|uniref:Uncharacterized protein n=1 Tax=Hypsizygus marmoreus TaxID=39966 RepID=A0A369J2Y5_HYPMA|nr:hypothetical protein Hypma_003057 [Hypsizygus marmoreus]